VEIDHEWITFVPIDFRQESWVDKLVENGFDTLKKTFFLWEGVTVYLEEESVKQTLKTVAKSSGRGSVIAFDFYSKAFITGGGSFLMKHSLKILKITGEPFKFGIDTTENASLLSIVYNVSLTPRHHNSLPWPDIVTFPSTYYLYSV